MQNLSYRSIAKTTALRQAELALLLRGAAPEVLDRPSVLPGWSRLTVVCHLRYGAEANLRMTQDILRGIPTAFYPGGADQRADTLVPRAGETPRDVVDSFTAACRHLDDAWSGLNEADWNRSLVEPGGSEDLGSLTLGQLALLRLTEVEVHGTDLDVGAKDWSRDFVEAAFDMRLLWLTERRPNPAVANHSVIGTWVLAPIDGDAFTVTASPSGVEVRRAQVLQPAVAYSQGSRRELLAFLLGRLPLDALDVTGNLGLAARFRDAFPPP